MDDNIELLSIGDASMDVFITPTESETECRLDTKECFICFSYGDKIPAKTLDFSIGGNAANNSVGTRRLGVNSAAVLTLGDDTVGNQIVEGLEKEGVNMAYVIRQPSTVSNYSTIINFLGERTILSYKAPRSYEFPVELPKTPWVYLTSMGETFRAFYNHFVDWLKKNPDVKLAYNPGSRQLRAELDQIKDVIELTDILYVNRKEAEKISGFSESHRKEKELLNTLMNMGVKRPIVTDGAEGAYAFDGEHYLKSGVLPVDSYERTGAGDSFGSGCLAALIKGKSFAEAMLWGTVNSASVIGYIGSQKGLLKEQELGIWLDRARSSGVEVKEF